MGRKNIDILMGTNFIYYIFYVRKTLARKQLKFSSFHTSLTPLERVA